jgi:hypothetical protein
MIQFTICYVEIIAIERLNRLSNKADSLMHSLMQLGLFDREIQTKLHYLEKI